MSPRNQGLGRRAMLSAAAFGGAALVAGGSPAAAEKAEKEVGAVEDLMREHGVLRRILLVYIETAPKLRAAPTAVPPNTLARAATLFRTFGEDYHERKLEEAYIFPAVKKAGGPAAPLIDVLKAQHDRGRQVTDYILAVTGKGAIGTGEAEPLARASQTFVLMYQNHTAREDTIVFPAWKATLSEQQLDEMGDKFEDIEKATFGKDGFDDAVSQIAAIEETLGLSDLAQFTAPPPPKA